MAWDFNPFDEGGIGGEDQDEGGVNPLDPLGLANIFDPGAKVGETTYRAVSPYITASGFANPSATPVVPGGATLRDSLVPEVLGSGQRTAPQATAAQLNTGLMAPGVATAGAGAGMAGQSFAQSGQTRDLQGGNLGLLYNAATGRVPSAAELQMQRGLGATQRGNLALAASARGTAASKVAAQRAAADANAMAGTDVLAQTSALRAGEQATARNALTGALSDVRAGDIQSGNLGLGVGNLGLGLGNLGLGAGTAQLQAETQTRLADLDAQLRQTGMDDQKRIATLGAILGIDARTQEGAIELEKLVAEAHLRTQAINAGIEVGNTQAGMQLLGAGISGVSTLGAGIAAGGK